MPRKSDPEKSCETCGVPLTRKQTGGRLEDRGTFLRRRYCSLSCANSKPLVGKQGNHWRARQHRKAACEACGATTSLHVHHCDANPANNTLPNLQTLCVHCHNFWHALLTRRGLPIAGRMPALLAGAGKTA